MIRCPRARLLLGSLLSVWLVAAPLAAQSEGDAPSDSVLDLPPGLEIDFQGTLSQSEDGGAEFSGPVAMTWKDSRIQADRMSLRERRYVEAEGNVLIVWGKSRVYGSRMTYDLETERGVIEDAMGVTLDEYLFWAKSVEKIGEDKLLLRKATVTTCTQPVPYWSFAVSSARIRIDKYARMRNVRLRATKAPIVYLPYLIWPVKEGRAAGLLMPEFHSTEERGRAITQELFIPLGRSADLTLLGRYYTEAGFGGGGTLRFIPNVNGSGIFSGFFIDDKVEGKERYRASFQQTQQFQNGFRMVADIETVSDSSYYTDYERDLNTASAPQTLARLEFSRNGPWASMNVRELRREQLSTGLVQQTLPEVEWRGRSRRLGKTPFYLTFESSIASIQQEGTTLNQNPDYLRGHIAPTITIPYSPSRWFDITPTVTYRYSYWTQQQRTPEGGGPDLLIDEPLTRQLWSYGIEMVGPKVFRIFGKDRKSTRFKHTLEPRVTYGFAESFDRFEDVLVYDEVDRLRGTGEQMTWALVQRLFAKRPKEIPKGPPISAEKIVLPDGTTYDASAEPDGGEESQDASEESKIDDSVPVEIASFEIGQVRSFEEDISVADVDGDGENETSKFSDIRIIGRFNPTENVSLDLRGTYDILFDAIQDVSLSGTLRNRLSSLRFSVFHVQGLGFTNGPPGPIGEPTLVPVEDSTQVRLTAGLSLLQDRLQFKVDGSYNADPPEGQSHFPDQRWQLQYATQCCTFLVERLTRAFATPEDRRELYFRVDLRGVGKLLDQSF